MQACVSPVWEDPRGRRQGNLSPSALWFVSVLLPSVCRTSSAFPAMLGLQFGEYGEVCRSVSTGPQSFLWASTGQGHVWRLKGSKVGQDCRMWLGVWGPVPHGRSSAWGIFSLWRWERSWQSPVLSLKIVTCAALSSWWMLFYSVPMSRCCRQSVLKLFLRVVFASL